MNEETVKTNSSNKELFVAYWQGYTKSGTAPANPPALKDTPTYIDVINTAFTVPGPDSTIDESFLITEHTKQSIIADTEFLQSRGQKVVMSINGSETVPWSSLEPIPFAKSVQKAAQDWKLDGIDLDNETWGTIPGTAFADVIKAIRDLMGNDFIISYPAYHPGRDGFLQQVQDELSWVMTMAYWNHYSSAVDLFTTYAKLIGSSDKVMMGVKPGMYGENQSTPIADVPKIIQYQPPGQNTNKAGAMMFSLTLDYCFYTSKDRFFWAEMIEKNLPTINNNC